MAPNFWSRCGRVRPQAGQASATSWSCPKQEGHFIGRRGGGHAYTLSKVPATVYSDPFTVAPYEQQTHTRGSPDRPWLHGQGAFERLAASSALFRSPGGGSPENDLRP